MIDTERVVVMVVEYVVMWMVYSNISFSDTIR
jgi:hypothetical protein